MLGIIKEHKQILIDFIYSFIAYALPTIVLQFVIQPIIAEKLSANGNGLFIALFSVLKLMINVFIMPLANLRLLRKKDCEKIDTLNAYFNFLFIMAFSRVESLNTEFFVSLYIFSNSLSSIEPTVSRDILLEYRSPTEVSLAISL